MRSCWSSTARVCACAAVTSTAESRGDRIRRTRAGNGMRKLTPQLYWRDLPEFTVFHDGGQFFTLLQDGDVGKRVAVHKQQVGQITCSDPADAVSHAHDLPAKPRGGDDRIHRRKTQQIDEMLDVASI